MKVKPINDLSMITRVVAILNGLLFCLQFTDFFICLFTNVQYDLLYFTLLLYLI